MAVPNKYMKISERLCSFIKSELWENACEVESSTTFESLGLDSIFLMEIVLFLERECHLHVSTEMLQGDALISVETLLSSVFKGCSGEGDA